MRGQYDSVLISAWLCLVFGLLLLGVERCLFVVGKVRESKGREFGWWERLRIWVQSDSMRVLTTE